MFGSKAKEDRRQEKAQPIMSRWNKGTLLEYIRGSARRGSSPLSRSSPLSGERERERACFRAFHAVGPNTKVFLCSKRCCWGIRATA